MISSGPLLSRLEELLQWQRQQQQKLFLEQKNKQKEKLNLARKQLVQSFSLGDPRKYVESFNSIRDVGNAVEEENKAGVKPFCEATTTLDSSPTDEVQSAMAFDDTPVKQSTKSFSELLEEKLHCGNKDSMNVDDVNSKPKRKFLKKGEGLARFQMKPLSLKPKVSNPLSTKENSIKNVSSKRKNSQSLTLINPVGSKVESKGLKESTGSQMKNEAGNPIMKSLENEKSKREQEELRVFELMEQHAANSSFCSTSSLVARFMEDSERSTPVKSAESSNSKNQNMCYATPSKLSNSTFHLGRRIGKHDREHTSSRANFHTTHLSHDERGKNEKKHIHFETENIQSDMVLTCVDSLQALSKEKHEADRSEGESSDHGNNVALTMLTPCPNVGVFMERPKMVDILYPSAPVPQWSGEGGFGDCEAWSECSCSCGDDLDHPHEQETVLSAQEEKSLPLTDVPTDFPSSPEIPHDGQTIVFKSALLRERYQELENEITFFKTENAKLSKLKRQHEEEVVQFKQEKKIMERTLKENTKNLEARIQEEQKKFARERQVFEKYCKGNKSHPTKLEREEIQALKKQITELKEELVSKDRRWSASQICARDRMRQLNKQIAQLKEENEKLKNEAAKVKKVRFSNYKNNTDSKMKILHAVNDQLGRLKVNDINAPVAVKNVVPRKHIPASILCQRNSDNDNQWCGRPLVQSTGVSDLENAPSDELAHVYYAERKDIHGRRTNDAVELNDDGNEFQFSEEEEIVHIDDEGSCKNKSDDSLRHLAFDTFYPDSDQNLDCSIEKVIEVNVVHSVAKQEENAIESGQENELQTKETSEIVPGVVTEDKEMRKASPHDRESNLYKILISGDQASSDQFATHSENLHPPTQNRNQSVSEQNRESESRDGYVQFLHSDGTREKKFPDGRQEIWYPNGNLKKVSSDKLFTKMIYYNGDVKETHLAQDQGMEKYFYAQTRTWQTTYADGVEILEFPSGQVECKKPNGEVEIRFANDCVQVKHADGSEEWTLKDGTRAKIDAAGNKEILLPNGQKEIHTKAHKRREYPDGTIKCLYPDGTMETRYCDGRIRLKDKDGNLVMDSGVR